MKVIQMLRRVLPVVMVAMVMMLMATSAFAQFSASLSGTVLDPTGAIVSGATVTLTNEATQIQSAVTTGGSGFYKFGELAPGSYTVVVTATGFATQTFSSIAISAELARDLDVKLSVGKTTQSVTVSADQVPVLDTADASISSTIGSEELNRLPIFGRDPFELLRTGVGITGDGARSGSGGAVTLPNNTSQNQSNFGIFQTENQIQISASGQRVTSNTYEIDGVTVDSLLHGGSTIITPNPEAVSQITILASNYDATLGRSVGAHILTVTNAGSNDYHGSLFFQYDEPGLNAYQAYGGPTSTPGVYAPPIRNDNAQREYAASIGGRIIKDKLFWHGSYEGGKSSLQSFSEQYVPTPQYYAGLAAARPTGLVASTLGVPSGQAVVRAVLPGSCTAIQGGAASSAVCMPVGNGFDIGSFAGGVGQYLANTQTGGGLDGIPDLEFAQIQTPSTYRGNQFNGRVDYFLTQKDQLAASFFTQKLDQTSLDATAGAAPDTALPFRPFNSSATFLYIHTFSPTLLNEARANYTRFSDNQIKDTAGQVNWGVPSMDTEGYGFGRIQLSILSSPDTPGVFAENTYEFRDTVTKILGSQSLRMGFVYRNEQDNDDLNGQDRPNYAFEGLWDTANDAPFFENLTANPYTGGPGNAQRYFRRNYAAGFVQDDWKVRSNLTLNVGVRYEYFGELTNKGFAINNLVLGPAGNQITGSHLALTNHLYPGTNDAFAPKFGFAWQPAREQGKLVVRGGVGVSFDNLDEEPISPSLENGPGLFNYGLFCGGCLAGTGAAGSGLVFEYGSSDSPSSYAANANLASGVNPVTGTPNNPLGGGTPEVETYGILPGMKQPTLYNYSLDTQYQLPYEMALTIGYQGSTGFHFLRLVNQDFIYPTATGTCATGGTCTLGVNQTPFYAAYVPTADVHTDYNALNVHLEKRMQHGVTFSGVYTWSKSLDNASEEGPGFQSNQTNPAFPATEYGPSDFDVRNRVNLVGVWTLPSPAGHGLMNAALGNWQANAIYTWHTGFPWTPVIGVPSEVFVNGAATIAPTRPTSYTGFATNNCSNGNFIPGKGGNFPLGGPSYFGYGTPGQPGIGRNSFNGPCYMDTDMSFAKEFHFVPWGHESLFRFTANFFNIFNQTNLTPISFGSTESLISFSTNPNNPAAPSNAPNPLFGQSPASDNGRVIEFTGRIQF